MAIDTNSDRTGPAASAEWPAFEALEDGRPVRPLHDERAYPTASERWERVASAIELRAPLEDVWRAIVEPGSMRHWLAVCHGSLGEPQNECRLDFEDGEFFLVRTSSVEPPHENGTAALDYTWRWLGIGQATAVSWRLQATEHGGTRVSVTEEARNPPADWRTWHGGGWPGILEQLAAYVRTGGGWRWPWRRMGPYAQIELPAPAHEAWEQLLSPPAIKFWLQRTHGTLEPGQTVRLVIGDASGPIDLIVRTHVETGQQFPSFLPHISFALCRPAWGREVGGHLWIEPAGLGSCILQVFNYGWEDLPPELALSERKLVTGFWTSALLRAQQLFQPRQLAPGGPHSWS